MRAQHQQGLGQCQQQDEQQFEPMVVLVQIRKLLEQVGFFSIAQIPFFLYDNNLI